MDQEQKRGNPLLAPPIPLIPPEPKSLEKNAYLELKLKSKPEQEDSPTYMLKIPYLTGLESVREILEWQHMYRQALEGQEIHGGPGRVAMARRLMKGTALNTFNVAMKDKQETVANCESAIRITLKAGLPMRVVAKQRRYMSRNCKKPKGMPTRQWLTRYLDLNMKLVQAGRIAHDPAQGPFNEDLVRLPDDQLIDAAYYGMPKSWKSQMALQNFDPVDHTIEELIEFCERMEVAEDEMGAAKQPASKPTESKAKKAPTATKQKPKPQPKGKGKRLYCELHGKGNHSTHECRDIQRLKEQKQSAPYKRRKPNEAEGATPGGTGGSGKPYGGKPFNKAQYFKYKGDQELNALIHKTIHKELLLFQEQSKPAESTPTEEDGAAQPSSDSELEAHNVEYRDVDVSEFTNLHIDDDKELV